MRKTAPLFIAPECSVSGCHHDGDQYLMIKCRACDHWFCEEHIEPAETDGATEGSGSHSERITSVPTVKLVDTGLSGLAYYLGYCRTCRARREQQAGRRRVDSSWLR